MVVLQDPVGSFVFWIPEDCIGCDDWTNEEECRKHGRREMYKVLRE